MNSQSCLRSLIALIILEIAILGTTYAQSDSLSGAPVVVDGKTLFRIQFGITGHTAETRAKMIAQRIELAANDFSFEPDSITTIDVEGAVNIISGDRFFMLIVEKDAQLSGKPKQVLGREYATIIRTAIESYRDARSKATILRGVLWSLVATLVFVLAMWLLRKFTERLLAPLRKRVHTIRIGEQEVIQATWIESLLFGATKLVRFLLMALAAYFYVGFVLGSFIWTWSFARSLFSLILNPLRTLGEGILRELPNLIFIAVLIVIARYVIRMVKFFFGEVMKGTVQLPNFHREWAMPTYKLVRTLIIILVVVICYPYIPGSSSAAFQGISIFAGLLFSLGSSSAVSNVVAGTILTYMRAYRVGDVVKIQDAMGMVVETTLLVTRMRTAKNVEIAIPNSTILNAQVVNYTNQAKLGKLALPTTVTIGYDTPWRQVHALLQLASERTPGVLKSPAPYVLQLALEDFFVRYELSVYVDESVPMFKVYSDLHENIQDAFNEYGVQIMSPHFEADRPIPAVVPKDRWFAAPAEEKKTGGTSEPNR